MGDLAFCARYPFTSQAKKYVSERGLEVTSGLVEKAESRVKEALSTGKIRRVALLPELLEEELALYAICRMIVSASGNRYMINRLAVSEAKKANEWLSSDEGKDEAAVEEVAAEFGIRFAKQGKGFSVNVAKYLAYTPRSVDYKLSNRALLGGMVPLSRHERVRMLEEAVRKKIETELPIKAEFPPEVKDAAKRLLAILPKLESSIAKIGQENYPPCIRRLLEELSMNVNLPHTARVALAIYLVRAGMAVDKVVEVFRGAPDFSEKTTRYQVEYLKQKGYSMPSCATMDSYGICVAECRCGTPMNFRADTHGRRLKQEEGGMR